MMRRLAALLWLFGVAAAHAQSGGIGGGGAGGSSTFNGGTVAGATTFQAGATVAGGLSVDRLLGTVAVTPQGATGSSALSVALAYALQNNTAAISGCDPTGATSVQTCLQGIESSAAANSTVTLAPGLLKIVTYPNPANTGQARFMWSNPQGALLTNNAGTTSQILTMNDNQEYYTLVAGSPYYNLTYGQNPNNSEPAPPPPAMRLDFNYSGYASNPNNHTGVSADLKLNISVPAPAAANQYSDQNVDGINAILTAADAGNGNHIAVSGTATRPLINTIVGFGEQASQLWGVYAQCLNQTGVAVALGGACHGLEADAGSQGDDVAMSAPLYGLNVAAQFEGYTTATPTITDGTVARIGRIVEVGTHGGTSYAYAGALIHTGGVIDTAAIDISATVALSQTCTVDAGVTDNVNNPGTIGSYYLRLPTFQNYWRANQYFQTNAYMSSGTQSFAVFPAGTAGSFTGSISGTTLTVTSVSAGLLYANASISGAGVTAGTTIVNQLTESPAGATGAGGTYTVSTSQTVASEVMTDTGATEALVQLTAPLTAAIPTGGAALTAYDANVGLMMAAGQQLNYDATHYSQSVFLGTGNKSEVETVGPNGLLMALYDSYAKSAIYTPSYGFGVCQNGTGTGCVDFTPGSSMGTIGADNNGTAIALNFAGALSDGGTAGVTCSGTPTSSYATKNGLVTHC